MPRVYFFLHRVRYCLLYIALFIYICSPVHGFSVDIPHAWDDCSTDILIDEESISNRPHIEAGYTASGDNNIGSMLEINDDNQSSRNFNRSSAFAGANISNRVWLRLGSWWIGKGSGWTDQYSGNADAAQLWIDLHSDGQSRSLYQPNASNQKLYAQWYGLGHSCPVQIGNTKGFIEVAVRNVLVKNYLERQVIGTVADKDFSGIVRVTSSDNDNETVYGKGWCFDAHAGLVSGRWRCQAAVDGLIGKINWRGLAVDDGYITSSGVFTDADGFLRDVGGDITGLSWNTDLSASVNPSFTLGLEYASHPCLLFNLALEPGENGVAGLGLAWPQKGSWIPYLRDYLTKDCIEIGITANNWKIRIASDDLLWKKPERALVEISTSLIQF